MTWLNRLDSQLSGQKHTIVWLKGENFMHEVSKYPVGYVGLGSVPWPKAPNQLTKWSTQISFLNPDIVRLGCIYSKSVSLVTCKHKSHDICKNFDKKFCQKSLVFSSFKSHFHKILFFHCIKHTQTIVLISAETGSLFNLK